MSKTILCLDIGGSHITAAVIEKEEGSFQNIKQIRENVNSMADQYTILDQWGKAISLVLKGLLSTVESIYISIPGPFDYEKGISLMDGMHKYQSLLYMDVKGYLSNTYNVNSEEIYFYNDAQAFLLGEVYHYNLINNKVVGLTLGTGLGSSLFYNNNVEDLNYGSAPFRKGIAEDYISTRGIVDYVNSFYGIEVSEVKQLIDNNKLENAKYAGFDFLTTSLTEFIKQYILPLQPDCIVLGGSIAKSHELFYTSLQHVISIPIKIASMDDLNLFYGMIKNAKQLN